MFFLPRSQPGDSERIRWQNIPLNLEREVVNSIEELKELFPENDDFSEIRLIEKKDIQWREKYTQYGRINKRYFNSLEPVAYKCPTCEEIVIGAPKVVDDTSIHDGHPLSGRLGYTVLCTNCYFRLDDHTIIQS